MITDFFRATGPSGVPLIVALLLIPSLGHTFQAEFRVAFDQVTSRSDGDYKGYQGVMKVFAEPIAINEGPYAEQAFLARVSSLSYVMADYNNNLYPQGSADFGLQGLSLKYMSHASEATYSIGLLNYRQTVKLPSMADATIDVKNIWIEPGYFVQDRVLLSILVDYTEWKRKAFDNDNLDLGILVKALLDDSINVEGSFIRSEYDDGNSISRSNEMRIEMDYYLRRNISVGGLVSLERGIRDEENKGFMIRSEFYMKKSIFFGAQWGRKKFKVNKAADARQVYLNLGYRW